MRTRCSIALVVGLALVVAPACNKQATTTTPATPTNVQMAQLSKALADAEATASKTLISLRDSGKISQAETVTVQNYILVAANTGKAMDAELVSADVWANQKTKIIQLWTNAGLSGAKANLSTTAGTIIDLMLTVVNQVMAAIGGPTL